MNKLKSILKTVSTKILAWRVYLTAVIVLVLFGYIALRLQDVASPKVDEQKMEERLSELQINRIRFDDDILREVERRSRQGPSTDPGRTGTQNPFN